MFDIEPPILTMTLAGKGGVGKSMFSLAFLDLCELNGVPVDVMQIDDQLRLEKALKKPVVSLDLRIAKRARQDPKALTKAFEPLHTAISEMKSHGRGLHVDVGATQQHSLFDYCSLVGLSEDLDDFGVKGIAFVLLTAEAEAIEQATRCLKLLKTVLPNLKPILIVNERDGSVADLPMGSDAERIFRSQLSPLLPTLATIQMPLVPAGSWQCFERRSMRFLDVVSLDTVGVMNATGLTRPEAKLARGDVQAVFDRIEQGLSLHLPFLRVGECV